MSFKRILTQIVDEICAQKKLSLQKYCDDWVLCVDEDILIYGYHFPINDGGASLACDDKSALAAILSAKGVPCVEHHFFMNSVHESFYGSRGNWGKMSALLEQYSRLVIKKNDGTGGNGVFLAQNELELERAVNAIFRNSRSLAICPYYEIEQEIRAIVLNDEIVLCYQKIRPCVVGDGARSVLELAAAIGWRGEISGSSPSYVPKIGEQALLNWKHNLGLGAQALECQPNEQISKLALAAARGAGVRFASIDIIKTNNQYLVLEINSGVMMESFASASSQNYQKAKQIYAKAIDYLLAQKGER